MLLGFVIGGTVSEKTFDDRRTTEHVYTIISHCEDNGTFMIMICSVSSAFRPDKTNYFILYSENQWISKLDKIGIFIDMKFH